MVDYHALHMNVLERAHRLLDLEGVYNHLYARGAHRAADTYQAQLELSAVWSMIVDVVRAEILDSPSRIDELRDLADRYLRQPHLQSLTIRNLLLASLFDAAYPRRKRNHIALIFWLTIITGGVAWLVKRHGPQWQFLFGSVAGAALGGSAILYTVQYRRRALMDHLRNEFRKGQFDDNVMRSRLKALDRKGSQLAGILYELLESKPLAYSDADIDRIVSTVGAEHWQLGMKIKSDWQRGLPHPVRIENADSC